MLPNAATWRSPPYLGIYYYNLSNTYITARSSVWARFRTGRWSASEAHRRCVRGSVRPERLDPPACPTLSGSASDGRVAIDDAALRAPGPAGLRGSGRGAQRVHLGPPVPQWSPAARGVITRRVNSANARGPLTSGFGCQRRPSDSCRDGGISTHDPLTPGRWRRCTRPWSLRSSLNGRVFPVGRGRRIRRSEHLRA